jgi:hypothetical protein
MTKTLNLPNADMPAHPLTITEKHEDGSTTQVPFLGITKREYFAAMALQGLLAGNTNENLSYQASNAVLIADELLKALDDNQNA